MGISDSGFSKKPTSGSTQINIPIEVESLSATAQDFVSCDSKKTCVDSGEAGFNVPSRTFGKAGHAAYPHSVD
jgi:hypothetical protein